MLTRKCRECGVERERSSNGELDTRGLLIYRDSEWKRWYGHKCNRCNSLANNPDQYKVKIKKVKSKRKCIFCKKILNYPRYFYHAGCGEAHITGDIDSYIYQVETF